MTTAASTRSVAARPSGRHGVGHLLATAGVWIDRFRSRRALAELDPRLLSDIGVTRAQADAESAKPFWES